MGEVKTFNWGSNYYLKGENVMSQYDENVKRAVNDWVLNASKSNEPIFNEQFRVVVDENGTRRVTQVLSKPMINAVKRTVLPKIAHIVKESTVMDVTSVKESLLVSDVTM